MKFLITIIAVIAAMVGLSLRKARPADVAITSVDDAMMALVRRVFGDYKHPNNGCGE